MPYMQSHEMAPNDPMTNKKKGQNKISRRSRPVNCTHWQAMLSMATYTGVAENIISKVGGPELHTMISEGVGPLDSPLNQ